MDRDAKESMFRVARSIAVTGVHLNWIGVSDRMVQLGYDDAPEMFGDPMIRGGIDALCRSNRKDPANDT